MYPDETVQQARRLLEDGLSVAQAAVRLGVAPATVRSWRDGAIRPRTTMCPRCGLRPLDVHAYSYLLGVYLGDGMLSVAPNGVARLRIFQDARYLDLIAECRAAMSAILPNRVGAVRRPGCVEITSYSKHWPCLFPQHGPGPKHRRPIVLEPWQREAVAADTRAFLRGLIHSDGCRFLNRVTVRGRRYEYPRYMFTNASDDIRGLFTEACDALDIGWRRTNARTVAVSRAADVAALDSFIGPKS